MLKSSRTGKLVSRRVRRESGFLSSTCFDVPTVRAPLRKDNRPRLPWTFTYSKGGLRSRSNLKKIESLSLCTPEYWPLKHRHLLLTLLHLRQVPCSVALGSCLPCSKIVTVVYSTQEDGSVEIPSVSSWNVRRWFRPRLRDGSRTKSWFRASILSWSWPKGGSQKWLILVLP